MSKLTAHLPLITVDFLNLPEKMTIIINHLRCAAIVGNVVDALVFVTVTISTVVFTTKVDSVGLDVIKVLVDVANVLSSVVKVDSIEAKGVASVVGIVCVLLSVVEVASEDDSDAVVIVEVSDAIDVLIFLVDCIFLH